MGGRKKSRKKIQRTASLGTKLLKTVF